MSALRSQGFVAGVPFVGGRLLSLDRIAFGSTFRKFHYGSAINVGRFMQSAQTVGCLKIFTRQDFIRSSSSNDLAVHEDHMICCGCLVEVMCGQNNRVTVILDRKSVV